MNCGEVALRLATYRDLDAYEQAEVQLHLRGCPSCRAMLEAFYEQDRLLQSLPQVSVSPEFTDKVWARIHSRQAWTWAWQPVAVALMAVILLAGMVGGTVYASAGALPGDPLYPIKRINEQIQWTFAFGEEARERLQEGLAERRREEARQVLEQKRRARWQFEGVLEAVGDASWVVDGVDVHLCGGEPALPLVEPGMRVRLDVESLGDRICLRGAHVLRQPGPTATEDFFPLRHPSPTASPTPAFPVASATPTPAPSWTPTVVGPQGAPGGRGSEPPTPTPQPPHTPRPPQTPTPTERPVRTPRPTLRPPTPTATPTVRPSPWPTARPVTPQPTRTPPMPTRRPTRTPRPWVTPPPPPPAPPEE
ncbi:MAG: DUF5667 domain-containing protein, partial [Anaerolineae bacterium]